MSGSIMAWLAALQVPAAPTEKAEQLDLSEIIMHHMTNSHELETPWKTYDLPHWAPVHLWGLTIDFSLTKHVVFLLLAAALVLIVMLLTAWRMKRVGPGAPKGFASVIEAMTLFVRDEVVMKNIGRGGQPYVPFITTLFFFILFANLLGLLPWGSTPTSNISVTGALALLSFIAIEVSGFLALGPRKYMKTIFYAPPGMGPVGGGLMMLIMTPVEFLGKLAKPFALAIRLFANMTAGHLVILAFIGLILLALPLGAGSLVIIPGPIVMAVSIMVLEILVALIQAYIFAMLTAVFIGLIRHAH
ncbi:MAG TPA: F0F1 ATP synthase subunit A [Longimicrobiales bacterium]|nr:F0F1 ATP synthase subunit A [Longimicrobiales bacterium]